MVFLPYKKYSKILNQLKYRDERLNWIVEYGISTKAITNALKDEETRWKRYFKSCQKVKQGESNVSQKRPSFLSKKHCKVKSFYIIKNNIRFDTYNKHIISLPILGKIRITEKKSKLPNISSVSSGFVIQEGNKYYVAIRYQVEPYQTIKEEEAIGIDLGIKHYATICDKMSRVNFITTADHFMFTEKYKKIQSKIIKIHQIISNKVEMNYGRLLNQWFINHPNDKLTDTIKNLMKGESYHTSNIKKLQYKQRKLEAKLKNIRKDFICKLVKRIVVRTKQSNQFTVPKYIAIENLSIKNMMKNIPFMYNNHKLHRFIGESGWFLFSLQLKNICTKFQCELRLADQFYASSKTCCKCGHIKKDLKLYQRVYRCKKCGNEIDRDENASINLCNLTDISNYTIYE